MNSNQASYLLHYGLYQFNEVTFKNGRVSPYTVRLPKTLLGDVFQVMAAATWRINKFSSLEAAHFIGIANSGIPLAEAIYEHGLRLGRRVKLSIIYPRKMEQSIEVADNEETTILIDNAVTTGETVVKVLDMISPFGHHPKTIVRIFDREDVGEDGLSTADRIKAQNGLDLISISRLRDIIPYLSIDERQAILSYQLLYGTTTFKEWIGG